MVSTKERNSRGRFQESTEFYFLEIGDLVQRRQEVGMLYEEGGQYREVVLHLSESFTSVVPGSERNKDKGCQWRVSRAHIVVLPITHWLRFLSLADGRKSQRTSIVSNTYLYIRDALSSAFLYSPSTLLVVVFVRLVALKPSVVLSGEG